MVPFLTDVNFNGRALRALLRAIPTLDVVRAQDVGLDGADDPTVLEWAAQNGRVLLTHDEKTMPGHAYQRLTAGQRMAGVVIVAVPIGGRVVADLILMIECSQDDEWENQVRYVPF
jgi:predicted nuclease of predicted toxin-antitoxin system